MTSSYAMPLLQVYLFSVTLSLLSLYPACKSSMTLTLLQFCLTNLLKMRIVLDESLLICVEELFSMVGHPLFNPSSQWLPL